MKKVINSQNAPAAIGPYVQAVQSGELVFTSGQIPINPEDGSIPAEIKQQTRQSQSNLLAILQAAQLTLNDIVKTTVFIKDMNEFNEINAAYEQFFTEQKASFPSRSCVEVARLPKDVKIEIEAIARRNQPK